MRRVDSERREKGEECMREREGGYKRGNGGLEAESGGEENGNLEVGLEAKRGEESEGNGLRREKEIECMRERR